MLSLMMMIRMMFFSHNYIVRVLPYLPEVYAVATNQAGMVWNCSILFSLFQLTEEVKSENRYCS